MERSVSCAERGSVYGGAADIRSYSASYARPAARVKRARSVSSWTRPPAAVHRSGSAKSVSGGGTRPAPGLNLRSYSASYAASYGPTLATADGGAGAGRGRAAAAEAAGGVQDVRRGGQGARVGAPRRQLDQR
ncbi:unnamed protein product [Urochloa humidicola]